MTNNTIPDKRTLSQLFVKGNDLYTEEWAKQMLMNVFSKKLDNMNAFVGVVKFPDREFLTYENQFHTTNQFQNSVYIGHIDMLLPDTDISSDRTAYTKLSFNLDGVYRMFVQISGGNIEDSSGNKFKDFVLSQFPTANKDFVFNKHAIHYLTDIVLEGANYHIAENGGFAADAVGVGSFTPSMEFEIGLSGYKAVML